MHEQIQRLKELQELDQELATLRQNHDKLKEEEAELNADQNRVQTMVDELVAAIEKLEGERNELRDALNQEQDNVAKAESRLPAIKTQKEYVAVLKEIDTAKKLNKDILDRIEEKNREIESLEQDKGEKDDELAALKEKVSSRMEDIQKELQEYEGANHKTSSQRDALLEEVPANIKKRYQMLLERRGGLAVVEARNGTCLGCNMQLPPQLFNSLFVVREIQTCPHCNRIIYIEQAS